MAYTIPQLGGMKEFNEMYVGAILLLQLLNDLHWCGAAQRIAIWASLLFPSRIRRGYILGQIFGNFCDYVIQFIVDIEFFVSE